MVPVLHLVDRGPDTPGVLRLVMGMVASGNALCVSGNHEAKLVRALKGSKVTVSHGLAESLAQMEAVLSESDFVVCLAAANERTRGLLNKRAFSLMRRGAFFVNLSRGELVDEEALECALDAGHLAGAALDVVVPEPLPADHPLRKARNLLLTPHVAGNMTLGYTCERNVQLFGENLENYAAGRPMHHLVDRRKGY